MGEMVTFPANGRTADGYLATPPRGRGPGVLLVQEYWGLVGHIKAVADRLAAAGYVVLAPDLYHGKEAKSPDDGGKLMMALNIGQASKDLRGGADYLVAASDVSPKRIAAMGFCMGGQLALFAACEAPDRICAVVDFYGVHPAVTPDVAQLSGPVLAHFATRDKSTPPDIANRFVEQLRAAGKEIEAHFYEADHAFFNNERPAYDPEAATLAWDRTLAFFSRVLA